MLRPGEYTRELAPGHDPSDPERQERETWTINDSGRFTYNMYREDCEGFTNSHATGSYTVDSSNISSSNSVANFQFDNPKIEAQKYCATPLTTAESVGADGRLGSLAESDGWEFCEKQQEGEKQKKTEGDDGDGAAAAASTGGEDDHQGDEKSTSSAV